MEEESIEEVIMKSHLLSGGIDNKFIKIFSDNSIKEIEYLTKLSSDK